jgi:hypothetical protein
MELNILSIHKNLIKPTIDADNSPTWTSKLEPLVEGEEYLNLILEDL